ncbi:50S ribosome-binding GTPase, partial [Methylophilaceae bacterium]|nr:50S ribosome-binding GTPase [Methylophilaceae bacterium]
PEITQHWLDYFNGQPKTQAITVSAKNKNDVKKILPLCQKLAPHRDSSIKPIRIMIMGVPNVGKSTIINALYHKKIAKVGDIPAVTKSQQRIEINKQTILTDTPGMMWPRISYELDGFFLAASNNIGSNAYDEIETALELADVIKLRYPESISKKYNLKAPFPEDEFFLDDIARQRGFVLKKGKPNLEKAAISFINDYRQGLLGRISLETPASRERMIETHA